MHRHLRTPNSRRRDEQLLRRYARVKELLRMDEEIKNKLKVSTTIPILEVRNVASS